MEAGSRFRAGPDATGKADTCRSEVLHGPAARNRHVPPGVHRFPAPWFLPERHVGEKLHGQGYLLSNDKGEGLSVTWLETVAANCSQ